MTDLLTVKEEDAKVFESVAVVWRGASRIERRKGIEDLDTACVEESEEGMLKKKENREEKENEGEKEKGWKKKGKRKEAKKERKTYWLAVRSKINKRKMGKTGNKKGGAYWAL